MLSMNSRTNASTAACFFVNPIRTHPHRSHALVDTDRFAAESSTTPQTRRRSSTKSDDSRVPDRDMNVRLRVSRLNARLSMRDPASIDAGCFLVEATGRWSVMTDAIRRPTRWHATEPDSSYARKLAVGHDVRPEAAIRSAPMPCSTLNRRRRRRFESTIEATWAEPPMNSSYSAKCEAAISGATEQYPSKTRTQINF